MAFDPFNSVGGYTVGIPPTPVIDSNGNITANVGSIANLSTGNITTTGNVTANFFYGNLVGNVTANIVVPGINTSVIFNDSGIAGGSQNLLFDKDNNILTVAGKTVTNSLTMGSGNTQFSTSSVLFAMTASASQNQVLHRTQANTISSIDYTVIATDPTSNTRQTSKLIASVLGNEVGYYEYGTIDMNGGVGDFRVNYTNGNVELTVTPVTAYTTQYRIMITSYKEG